MKAAVGFASGLAILSCVALGVLIDRRILLEKPKTHSLPQDRPSPGAANSNATAVRSNFLPASRARLRAPREEPAGSMTLSEARAALNRVLSENPRHRYETVTKIARALAASDLPEGWSLAQTLSDPELKMAFGRAVLERWAEADPGAALKQVQALTNPQERITALSAVVSGWAQQDPESALAWVQQLPPGRQRSDAARNVVRVLADSDPTQAWAVAERALTLEERRSTASWLFDMWARKDPAAAAAKAAEVLNTPDSQFVFRSIASHWAKSDKH